ncbi:Exodeoxyribonuclease 1 [Mycena venus]|uniref:Exodeoxyribonuclease 1 n=1 Tax=Mycena venus TaxID=2733690 RepID=A0A8H6XCM5_9AGAR|nr:Exodeoxyribonuclease 1 [Mycena venus]
MRLPPEHPRNRPQDSTHTLLRAYGTVAEVPDALAEDGEVSIPPAYLQRFRLAEKCFLHQRVHDPSKKSLVPNAFVGPNLEPEVTQKLA